MKKLYIIKNPKIKIKDTYDLIKISTMATLKEKITIQKQTTKITTNLREEKYNNQQ